MREWVWVNLPNLESSLSQRSKQALEPFKASSTRNTFLNFYLYLKHNNS
jgi:hypothetical protein